MSLLIVCQFDVVDTHYKKNRKPKVPEPATLNAIVNSKKGRQELQRPKIAMEESEDSEESEESNSEDKRGHHRAQHNTKGTKKREFTQLQNYPPMWKKVLDSAKKIARRDAFLDGAFNTRMVGLKCAGDSLTEAIAAHEQDGGRVEKGETTSMCYEQYAYHGYRLLS